MTETWRHACDIIAHDHVLHVLHVTVIKNKLATVLVMIVKADYPERWASFFQSEYSAFNMHDTRISSIPHARHAHNMHTVCTRYAHHMCCSCSLSAPSDFLSLLDAGGIEVMDLFLRVLKVIDEDVVSPDELRAKQEQIKNTQIVSGDMEQGGMKHQRGAWSMEHGTGNWNMEHRLAIPHALQVQHELFMC